MYRTNQHLYVPAYTLYIWSLRLACRSGLNRQTDENPNAEGGVWIFICFYLNRANKLN